MRTEFTSEVSSIARRLTYKRPFNKNGIEEKIRDKYTYREYEHCCIWRHLTRCRRLKILQVHTRSDKAVKERHKYARYQRNQDAFTRYCFLTGALLSICNSIQDN